MGVNRMLILKGISTAGLFADEQAAHASGEGFGIADDDDDDAPPAAATEVDDDTDSE